MITYNDLINKPLTMYHGVYIKPIYVFKYERPPYELLRDIMYENTNSFDFLNKEYDYTFLYEYYDNYGYKFYDFVKLHSIYIGRLTNNGEIKRKFEVFNDSSIVDMLNKFKHYIDTEMTENDFFVGFDLLYELSIIIRSMIENGVKVGNKFIMLLDSKPWDCSYVDIRSMWKTLDIYGNKSTLSSISDSLGIFDDKILPMKEIVKLKPEENSNVLKMQGINYVNQYSRIINKLRQNK